MKNNAINIQDLIEELEVFEIDEATNADKVRTAQSMLRTAIDLLQKVCDETSDGHAEAYVVDHLRIMTGSNHGFLSRDYNLDQWIECLERNSDEDE